MIDNNSYRFLKSVELQSKEKPLLTTLDLLWEGNKYDEYESSLDAGHIERIEELPAPTERFVIAVTPKGRAAMEDYRRGRASDIRSYVAIAISVIALIVSLFK